MNSKKGQCAARQWKTAWGQKGFWIPFTFILLACNILTFRQQVLSSSQPVNVNAVIGPSGGILSHPGGMQLNIPAGALSTDVNVSILTANASDVTSELYQSVEYAGQLYSVDAGGVEMSGPIELRFKIEILQGKDPSLYTVYTRPSGGGVWTDAGGFIEGDWLKIWTSHLSMFVPVAGGNIHRPIGFINSGPYHATVTVSGYRADPRYTVDPRLFPFPSTVSFAPSAPYWPNPSRFLSLPPGGYIFCYYWTDGRDENKDSIMDYYHSYTSPIFELGIESPNDMDMAPNINIRTDNSDAKPGDCGTYQNTTSVLPPLAPRATPITQEEEPEPEDDITITPSITAHLPITITPSITMGPPTKTRTKTPTASETRKRVDWQIPNNEFRKKADDNFASCAERNCKPVYSGCYLDCSNVPTYFKNAIFNSYFINLEPEDYIPRADSVAEYVLEHQKSCNEAFLNSKGSNTRGKELYDCIKKYSEVGMKMLDVAFQQTCSVHCSREGKIGVVEGVPRVCNCKDE
jgi:hypothetical protein